MDFLARSVYTMSLPAMNGRSLYLAAFEFAALSESKRRRIVRQVYKYQQNSLSGSANSAQAQY